MVAGAQLVDEGREVAQQAEAVQRQVAVQEATQTGNHGHPQGLLAQVSALGEGHGTSLRKELQDLGSS